MSGEQTEVVHETGLEVPGSAFAWKARTMWATQREAVATMDESCMIRTVVGRVSTVAATGAFFVLDGWHLPVDRVLRLEGATVEDQDRYRAALAVAEQEEFMAGVPLERRRETT